MKAIKSIFKIQYLFFGYSPLAQAVTILYTHTHTHKVHNIWTQSEQFYFMLSFISVGFRLSAQPHFFDCLLDQLVAEWKGSQFLSWNKAKNTQKKDPDSGSSSFAFYLDVLKQFIFLLELFPLCSKLSHKFLWSTHYKLAGCCQRYPTSVFCLAHRAVWKLVNIN